MSNDIITDINLNNYNEDEDNIVTNIFDKINEYISPDNDIDYINLIERIIIPLKLLGKTIWTFLTNHLDKLFDIIINSLTLI